MKEFERPQIIDTFESPEGVYLASGSTHDNPPPEEKNELFWWEHYFTSHDGGSHSDYRIKIHSQGGVGKHKFHIKAELNDFTQPIDYLADFQANCGLTRPTTMTGPMTEFEFDMEFDFHSTSTAEAWVQIFFKRLIEDPNFTTAAYKHYNGAPNNQHGEAQQAFAFKCTQIY